MVAFARREGEGGGRRESAKERAEVEAGEGD